MWRCGRWLLVCLLLVTASVAIAQEDRKPPAKAEKGRQKQEDPEKLLALERVLLTPPQGNAQGQAFSAAWQRCLQVRVAFHLGVQKAALGRPTLDAALIGLGIANRSPCTVRVIAEDHNRQFLVNGRKGDQPDWVAEPNEGISLAIANRVSLVPLPFGPPNAVVDSVVQGPICSLEVLPNRSDLPPIKLTVRYSYGTLGPKIVSCRYTVFPMDKSDEAELNRRRPPQRDPQAAPRRR